MRTRQPTSEVVVRACSGAVGSGPGVSRIMKLLHQHRGAEFLEINKAEPGEMSRRRNQDLHKKRIDKGLTG